MMNCLCKRELLVLENLSFIVNLSQCSMVVITILGLKRRKFPYLLIMLPKILQQLSTLKII